MYFHDFFLGMLLDVLEVDTLLEVVIEELGQMTVGLWSRAVETVILGFPIFGLSHLKFELVLILR